VFLLGEIVSFLLVFEKKEGGFLEKKTGFFENGDSF
jgi:hypothetical protein